VEGKKRHGNSFGVERRRREVAAVWHRRLNWWERRLKRHFIVPARVVEA
jgi:hypothetical protein